MTQTVGKIEQLTHEKPPLPNMARLSPVRSDALLAEALTAICALVQELSGYTSVHGTDDDDEQALALGRGVLSKANSVPAGACCATCEHWDGYHASEYDACLMTGKRVARLHVCAQWKLLLELQSNAEHDTRRKAT